MKKFVYLCIIILLIWIINWILLVLIMPNCWEQRGAFGDMFGAINALFTGLAFAAVIYTLKNQENDRKRNDFESIFFNLLRNYNDMKNNYYYEDTSGGYPQIKSFNAYILMIEAYDQLSEYVARVPTDKPQAIKVKYEELLAKQKYRFIEHFMANVDFILKYIHRHKNSIDVKEYRSVLINQLSLQEKRWLYIYNIANNNVEGENIFDNVFKSEYLKNIVS